MIGYAITAGAISLGIAPAFLFASPPADLDRYLVQMHIYAHTNHDGGDGGAMVFSNPTWLIPERPGN